MKIFTPDSSIASDVIPSANYGERHKSRQPDMIVLHYTGMPDVEGAIAQLCTAGTDVSAHYIVLEDCIAAVEAATARRDRLEAHIEAALPEAMWAAIASPPGPLANGPDGARVLQVVDHTHAHDRVERPVRDGECIGVALLDPDPGVASELLPGRLDVRFRRVEQHDLAVPAVLVGQASVAGTHFDQASARGRQQRPDRDAIAAILVVALRPEDIAVPEVVVARDLMVGRRGAGGAMLGARVGINGRNRLGGRRGIGRAKLSVRG